MTTMHCNVVVVVLHEISEYRVSALLLHVLIVDTDGVLLNWEPKVQ